MIDKLAEVLDDTTKQSWYADDAAACGMLRKLKDWWVKLYDIGTSFGYFSQVNEGLIPYLAGQKYTIRFYD